ncbi:class III lanthionine synthetase LanKC [Luethyella okanaganae]|uniref:non-specific serine/threonine protein kinase n=1 Tax=Luethyella okanaganae TaxID=69372 RepID=A0ABW1VGC5_9MICO
MDPTYLRFTAADPVFYDIPTLHRTARRTVRYHPADGQAWAGWEHHDDGFWSFWRPADRQLPDQGWKIHVTTTPADAARVLRLVSAYCHDHSLPFKHLPGLDELRAANAKDADRAASGKFITIYPGDVAELQSALNGLDALIGGTPGPYVLSDLRWKDGPLFVRYGSFVRTIARDPDGRQILAVRNPDGALVEDRRGAGFAPPPWVELPGFLSEQLDALGAGTAPADFGYQITRVLHYSNAGGVYQATTPTGDPVVLKEARPHAGLTPDGRDARDRLIDEESRLRALAGPTVVAVRESFDFHGHRFLVLDHVDGANLGAEIVARCPAIRATAAPADYLEYRQWALGIAAQLDEAFGRIHAAGYVHGDLHPNNVLVAPDGSIVLLDFEMARSASDDAAAVIGAPGFVALDGRGGLAADRYALACLKLFLFFPLTPLLGLDPLKADDLLDAARDAYALDETWLAGVRAGLALPGRDSLGSRSRLARAADTAIRSWSVGSEDAVLALQVMIGRSLGASADFSRADRAWPGDIRQFAENGYGLAHGAAGVIHALDACSLDIDPQAFDWLADATGFADGTSEAQQLGLYDGLAGVAWLHRQHSRDRQADELLNRLRAIDPSRLGSDLYGGMPGLGLYLLAEAERDPALETDAVQIATILRARHDARPRLDPGDAAPTVRTGRGGLMWGPSGTALFALRLYERTGDRAHLRLAVDALDRDLASCAVAGDGSLQVNEGWRLMPYLATGSAGIGLVIAGLLPHLGDPHRYLAALDGIRAAASTPFVIEPGLFHGRAGLIHFLAYLARTGLGTAASDAALLAHVEALKIHAVRHRTGIAFPGQGLLRLSCDFATGSAGVLTALQAHGLLAHDESRDGWDTLLPLLLPAPASRLVLTNPRPPHEERG